MNRRFDEEYDGPALAKCRALGLDPKPWPNGVRHHTMIEFDPADLAVGEALAYFLGTMYADVDADYFYTRRTSSEEWSRVARALRVHGLEIANATRKGTAP